VGSAVPPTSAGTCPTLNGSDPEVTRLALEHAAIPILWVTPDGRCGYANRAASRMLGYSREELLSATISDLDLDFPPRRWPGFWDSLRQTPSLEFTSVYRSKEGRIFPVEIVASHFECEGTEYAVASAREISEQREAERILRESQERLKILFEYAPDAYYLSDLGGRFVDANRAAEELTGYARHELIGRSFLTLGLLDPEQVPVAARTLSLNALGRPVGPGELVLTHKEGRRIWVEIRTYPLKIQGEYLILGIARDITARKRSERDLRLTQFTVDRAVDAVFWIGTDGRILHANEAACRGLGYSREQLQKKQIWDIDPHASRESWSDLLTRIQADGSETFTSEHMGSDGCLIPVEVAVSHLEFEGEEYAVAFTRNIRERLLVERAVERSEAEFRAIFEESPYGILRTKPNGEILMANPAIAEMLGYRSPRELRALNMERQVWADSEDRRRLVTSALEAGKLDGEAVRWRRKDGEEITVRLSSRLVRDDAGRVEFFEDMVEDISERLRLEDQLRQAQKMEAVGQLTGGIAHDFNNLLSVILLNSELIRTAIQFDTLVPMEDLEEIEEAARKAAAMTRKLLGFSRQASLTLVPTDLSRVVLNLSSLLRRLMPENIQLTVEACEDLPAVEADVGSVEQMILNLATNSRDAMPQGGTLSLATGLKTFTEEETQDIPWMVPGTYVGIYVCDTGVGMAESTLARVFEPFFTTKPVGEGTGLGMAMVYGLTKQHGGFVRVESALRRGTRVELFFPLSVGVRDNRPPPRRQARPQEGTETILLVEDEDALRRSGRRVLERFGYAVLLAADGVEGLEVYRQNRGEIDLIISDMVMPRLGGAELYRALRDEGEGVPFLMVSGYTGDEATERKILDPGVPILPKPWDVSDLLQHVRNLLD